MLIRPCYRVLKAINYLCDIADSHTTSSLDLIVYFHNHVKDLDLYATLQQLVSDEYITATFGQTRYCCQTENCVGISSGCMIYYI